MGKNLQIRKSSIMYNIQDLSAKITLKTASSKTGRLTYIKWENKGYTTKQEIKNNTCPLIVVPKYVKYDISQEDKDKILQLAIHLLNKYFKRTNKTYVEKPHRSK